MPTPKNTAERHASPVADKVAARLAALGTAPANALTALLLTATVVTVGVALTDSPQPPSNTRPYASGMSLLDLSERAQAVSRFASRDLATAATPETATRADRSLDATTYRTAEAEAEAARKARIEERRLARIAAAKAAAEERRLARIAAAKAAAEAARKEAAAKAAAEAAAEAAEQAAIDAAATDPGTLRDMARNEMLAFGFAADQWPYLDRLVMRESGWNPLAQNPSSGAYGLPQSLPGSKMASVGADWRTNPVTQIRWMLGYIKGRYGSPQAAFGHSESVGWY